MEMSGKKPTSSHSSVQAVRSPCVRAFHEMKARLRFVDIRNNALRVQRFPSASLTLTCVTILLLASTSQLSFYCFLFFLLPAETQRFLRKESLLYWSLFRKCFTLILNKSLSCPDITPTHLQLHRLSNNKMQARLIQILLIS